MDTTRSRSRIAHGAQREIDMQTVERMQKEDDLDLDALRRLKGHRNDRLDYLVIGVGLLALAFYLGVRLVVTL